MFAVVYLQEEALAAEFTIKETMYYFGILFEMKFSCIRQRVEFLKQFLDLPPVNQLCGALRLVGNIVMEFEIMVDHWSFVKFSYCIAVYALIVPLVMYTLVIGNCCQLQCGHIMFLL